ncbi:Tc toxin subunit A-related protein [Reichenbachiella sp.]
MSTPNQTWNISGKLLKPDNTPFEGLTVKTIDKIIGFDPLLGETTTDSEGNFSFSFTKSDLYHSQSGKLDLWIKVYDTTGDYPIFMASELLFSPEQDLTLELLVYPLDHPWPTEYEELVANAGDTITDAWINSYDKEQFIALAEETEIDVSKLHDLINARILSKELNLEEEPIYGLLRRGIPYNPEAFVHFDEAKKLSALKFLLEHREGTIKMEVFDPAIDPVEDFVSRISDLKDSYEKKNPVIVLHEHDGHGLNLHFSALDKTTQAKIYWKSIEYVQVNNDPTINRYNYQYSNPYKHHFWKEVSEEGLLTDQEVMYLSPILSQGSAFQVFLRMFSWNRNYRRAKFTSFTQFGHYSFYNVGELFMDNFWSLSVDDIIEYFGELIGGRQFKAFDYLINSMKNDRVLRQLPGLQWLERNHHFTPQLESIENYLKRLPESISDYPNKDEIKGSLGSIAKIYRLAGYNTFITRALLRLGLDSVQKINALPAPEFHSKVAYYYEQGFISDVQDIYGQIEPDIIAIMNRQPSEGPAGVLDAKQLQAISNVYARASALMVKGVVKSIYGEGISGLRVVAYDKEVGSLEYLGEAITNGAGEYTISYVLMQLSTPDKEKADLQVRVYDPKMEPASLLALSEVVLDASDEETIDFEIEAGKEVMVSEYDWLHDALSPILEGWGLQNWGVEELTQFARKIDADISLVDHYVKSKTLAQKIESLPEELIYGLLRTGNSPLVNKLLHTNQVQLEKSLLLAVEKFIISPVYKKNIPEYLETINTAKMNYDLAEGSDFKNHSILGLALDLSRLSLTKQAKVYLAYQAQDENKSEEQFWEALETEKILTKTEIANFKRTWEITTYYGYFPELRKVLENKNIRRVYDIANLPINELVELFNPYLSPTPSLEDYLILCAHKEGKVYKAFKEIMPTAFLVSLLHQENSYKNNPAIVFLKKHPAFEFSTQNIKQYLEENPVSLEGFHDLKLLRKELYRLQRTFHLAEGNPVLAKALIDLGIDSAEKLRGKGRETFKAGFMYPLQKNCAAHFAPFLDKSETIEDIVQSEHFFLTETRIDQLYDRATRIQHLSIALFSKYSRLFNNVSVMNSGEATDGIPGIEAVFGDMDYRECDHCQSVLSPGAYLVDILNFLKGIRNPSGSALEEFYKRRPDIPKLKVTCDNALKPLPLLDIANEVLEDAVLEWVEPINSITVKGKVIEKKSKNPVGNVAVQLIANDVKNGTYLNTTLTSGEGEFTTVVDPRVFSDRLTNPYPDLFFRIYKDNRLLYASDKSGLKDITSHLQFTEMVINDRLLHPSEGDKEYLVQGKIYDSTTHLPLQGIAVQLWDKDPSKDDLLGIAYTDVDGIYRISYTTYSFYDRNRETAPDLIYKCYHQEQLIFDSSKDPITDFTGTTLEKDLYVEYKEYHQGNSGWNVYTALAKATFPWNTPFNVWQEEAALYLSKVNLSKKLFLQSFPNQESMGQQLEIAKLGLSILPNEEYIFYGHPSKELTAFVKKYYNLTQSESLSRLNSVRELLASSAMQFDELQHILSARFVNPKQKTIEYELNGEIEKAKIKLSANELDRLHRFRRLQLKTGWKVSDLDQVLQAGHGKITETTLILLNHLNDLFERFSIPISELISWHLDIGTLTYHEEISAYENLFFSGKTNEEIPADSCFKLDAKRSKLLNKTTLTDGWPEEVALVLVEVFHVSFQELDLILAQLDNSKVLSISLLSSLHRIISFRKVMGWSIQEYFDWKKIFGYTPVEPAKSELLKDAFDSTSTFLDQYTKVNAFGSASLGYLIGSASDLFNEETSVIASTLVEQVDRKKNVAASLIALLSNAFQLSQDIIEIILESDFSDSYKTINILQIFLDDGDNVEDVLHLLHYLKKLQVSQEILSIDPHELFEMFRHEQYFPFRKTIKEQLLFENLNQFIYTMDAVAASIALNSRNIKLQEWFERLSENKSSSEVQTLLATSFGWQEPDLAYYLDQIGSEKVMDLAHDFHQLWQLSNLMNLVNHYGYSLGQLYSILFIDLHTHDSIDKMKSLLAFKFSSRQWKEINQEVNSEFSEKKRDALMSFLLLNRKSSDGAPFNKPSDIYEHFLIDTESSAVLLTSRIKQAISSVQLFVQRMELGLEPYPLNAENIKEWSWKKNYRVWEANRKVFLFPENWLEPNLRIHKSSFFKEAEDEINQMVIDEQSIEKVYLQYLNKIDRLSKIEITGMAHKSVEFLDRFKEDVYVFAKTKELPEQHYYRKLEKSLLWGAWKKIDMEVESDYLLPHVDEDSNRLRLYWLIIKEVPTIPESIDVPATGGESVAVDKPKVEYQWAYSELINGSWSEKKLSKESYPFPNYPEHNAQNPDVFIQDLQIKQLSQYNYEYQNNAELYLSYNNSFLAMNWEAKKGEGIISKSSAHENTHRHYYVRTASNVLKYKNKQYSTADHFDQFHDQYFLVFYNQNSRHGEINTYSLSNIPVLTKVPGFNLINHRNIARTSCNTPYILDMGENKVYTKTVMGVHYEKTAEERGDQYARRFEFTYLNTSLHRVLREAFEEKGVANVMHGSTFKNHILDRQLATDKGADFNSLEPIDKVIYNKKPSIDFGFGVDHPDRIYNWEIFYHLPMLLAEKLKLENRFSEAHKWYSYLFDPTIQQAESESDIPIPTSIRNHYSITLERYNRSRFWKIKPFFLFDGTHDLINELDDLNNSASTSLADQIALWERYPFDPHIIADLRTSAYMKSTVMRYLDNLLAWGDHLFQQFTMESINEALQIYQLAKQVLGERPHALPRLSTVELTLGKITDESDSFSNALEEIEGAFPNINMEEINEIPTTGIDSQDANRDLVFSVFTPYFCIPFNEKLLSYWSTVEDRLFKIRNGFNIEGTRIQPPLFQPPIDPGQLIAAFGAGARPDQTVLQQSIMQLPQYRFQSVIAKAYEMCNAVVGLGNQLMGALEKADAETLSLLKAKHENELLTLIRSNKEKQINETQKTIDGLIKAKERASLRQNYYESREYMNAWEITSLSLSGAALILSGTSGFMNSLAAGASLFPDIKAGASGFGGTPHVVLEVAGGKKTSDAFSKTAAVLNTIAGISDRSASMASSVGNYQRRKEDWDFQKNLASKEIEQLQLQIDGTNIRLEMAIKELESHHLQITQAKETHDWMKNKYTNKELYLWMGKEVSGLYLKIYQLAYDLASKAQACYSYELGLVKTDFIQFGYWDTMRKGLMSGERLMTDLRRMEASYLEENKREFELTKHISLSQLNSKALLDLKEKGDCKFILPETVFDLDHPGHFFRRIKSVSLTIPCITGPYTNINCKLTLLESMIRKSNETESAYGYHEGSGGDDRFRKNSLNVESISTSSAQNDSGVFELNFRDERYLPFEGAGVISLWQIEMPDTFRQFDYDSISDVIIHMNYTARDGGDVFRKKVEEHIETGLNEIVDYFTTSGESLQLLLDLKNNFLDSYYQLFDISDETETQTQFEVTQNFLPYFLKEKKAELKNISVLIKTKEKETLKDIEVSIGKAEESWPSLGKFTPYSNGVQLYQSTFDTQQLVVNKWQIKLSGPGVNKLKEEMIESFVIVGDYTVS